MGLPKIFDFGYIVLIDFGGKLIKKQEILKQSCKDMIT